MDPRYLATEQQQQQQPPPQQSRSNGLSAAARRSQRKHVVEATPERQIIYNRIREEVARQQHDHQWLRPPAHRSTPMSRASSSGGTSPTAALEAPLETGEPHRRPRGRRGGPLNTDVRFKTALRRALKLVCKDCRSRKVACDCYDVSRLEAAYAASHGASQSAGVLQSRSRASSRARPSPQREEPDLFGLGTSELATYIPVSPNISESDWGESSTLAQPPNTRPDVQLYASQFNAHTLLPGAPPTPAKSMAYVPVLGNSVENEMALLGAGFPVGSEIAEDTGRWRCEFSPDSGTCSWTGSVDELSQHWKASHHPIRQEEQWCECVRCSCLRMGWDKPWLCLDATCSPTGAVWKRWLYGHTLVESTVASTPALTQSGESENGSYDPRASWNTMLPGSRDSSFAQSDTFGIGSFFSRCHSCSEYQKESHSAEDGGESSGHASEPSAGSPIDLPASTNSQPPPISKDTYHTADTPPPPRVHSGIQGCNVSHPPISWAKKMPQIFCTMAASGVATAILEAHCFLGASLYVARVLSTTLTMPWISFFLICCSFALTWLVQTWWSAVPYCQGGLPLRNAALPRVPVSPSDAGPRHLRPNQQTRHSSGGFDTVAAFS